MPIRAIILAVENYGALQGGLISKLKGTLEDADAFQGWLVQTKKVEAPNITVVKDPTAAQISTAFRNLVDQGHDGTEELYVFYSGHGFSYNDNPLAQKPADILVGAEFENLNDSGNACLKLSDIQLALFNCLGPGAHYYFVDACRNPVKAADCIPEGLGWRRPFSGLGSPDVFTLFSTQRGNFAAVRSGFVPAVIDGLTGRGTAKRREGLEMWVSFDSLRRYLETSRAQKIASDPGQGPGHILRIDPIPKYRCTVRIKNASNADQFTAKLLNAFSVTVGEAVPFQGDRGTLEAAPDDYFVQVTHRQFALKPPEPAKADLYDDCSVEFEKTNTAVTPELAVAAPVPSVPVYITGPTTASIEVTNVRTGEVLPKAPASFQGTLQPGPYRVRVLESGWTAVRNFQFQVDYTAGAAGLHIDAASRDPSPLRDAVLGLVPGSHDAALVDFSESLGPLAVQDLGLWLSILGASRILGPGQFSKLGNLPLISFDDVQAGASPIYLLAGAEGAVGVSAAAVWEPGKPQPPLWPMNSVPGVPGLFELRVDSAAGMHIVLFRAGEQAKCATVTYCIPNRATLFILASDTTGVTRIHQFLLPIEKLKGFLTPMEQATQPPNLLEALRFTMLAQKQMGRMRSPVPPASSDLEKDPKLEADRQAWNFLLHGKWLDPVMALMAGYELARHHKSPQSTGLLPTAVQNLRTYFSALPDTEAVAKIAGLAFTEPASLPLFMAGVRVLENPGVLMPLPEGLLDYSGLWTTWIGV
jgi:hypothetical protein